MRRARREGTSRSARTIAAGRALGTAARALGTAARALGAGPLALGGSATAALVRSMPRTPVAVIGLSDVYALIWPLAPVLFAACLPASTAWRRRTQERTAVRSQLQLAMLHLALVLAAAALPVLVAPAAQRAVLVRNLAALVGLAMASARALPARAAWSPMVAVGFTTWLFGTRRGGDPHRWALLLAPAGDGGAALPSPADPSLTGSVAGSATGSVAALLAVSLLTVGVIAHLWPPSAPR